MRCIIAGSRSLGRAALDEAISQCNWATEITEVVSGKCPKGIDKHGENWAKERGYPVIPYPAKWKRFGKPAGFIRNAQMAKESGAEALLAVHDGVSPGTSNMVEEADKQGLRIFVWTVSLKR